MENFIQTLNPAIPYSTLVTLKDKGTDISKAGKYARSVIEEYFENGIVHEHSVGYRLQKIWRIKRPDAEAIFHARGYDQNRTIMLWHGTKAQNVVSILKNGFSIAASRGGMFGTGIYFADRASKSIQYCGETKVLFLCEVAVGTMYFEKKANSFEQPPVRRGIIFDSVKGVGKWEPDPLTKKRLGKAIVPTGCTVRNARIDDHVASLNYNEYIVYDENRILLKYIVTFDKHDTLPSTINANTYRRPIPLTTNRTTNRSTTSATTYPPKLTSTYPSALTPSTNMNTNSSTLISSTTNESKFISTIKILFHIIRYVFRITFRISDMFGDSM